MQDYKTRRTPKDRSMLRGRFAWLRRRKGRALPKGFRPLSPLRPAEARSSSAARPIQLRSWFKQVRILRWVYGAIVAWVLVGVTLRGWTLWQGSLERVRVSGLVSLSTAQVVELSGLTSGLRLSDLDPFAISLRLRQDPRVEAVDARRVYPHTVWIDVRERMPDARVLVDDGRAALVDRYNFVIRMEAPRSGDFPLIRGVGGSAQPGAALAAVGLTRARVFLAQAKDSGVAGFDHAILDVSDPDSVVVIGSGAPRLVFPVNRAADVLRLYKQIAGPGGPGVVAQALSSASQADFRFARWQDGGRLYLRP
jgi:cell division septal protein FtsQ